MVSQAVKLFGTDEVDPPMRLLRAGPLSAEFDRGALRYIRFGGVEVLRAIAFLVRDENWGTFTPTIEDLDIDERPDGFSVRYRATCADAVRSLVYDATITGGSDGQLSFDAVAEPQTDILTNRTGFVVLHPLAGVAGRPVTVLHVDGREERSVFPETIDPACPFKDIRALSHEIAPDLWATCTMEGDTFEMEDQRNWSDASYKTYVRPLTRPWPYTLPKGERVSQAIRLAVSGTSAPAAPEDRDETVSIRIGSEAGRLPAIGLGVPAEEAAHALEHADLLRRLAPRWLVCQVDLRQEPARADLDRYCALGEATGAEIVLEIITAGSLDPAAELAPVAKAAAACGLDPAAIAVFPAQDMKSVQPNAPWPDMPSFEETYAAARAAFPNARLGGGMAAYFTELNRKPPPADRLDYVTYTTCPTVHAADDRSVMETIEALPYLIGSTRALVGDALPCRIGPSQLGCRENPYGSSTTANPQNGRVCLGASDPRQRGLFNAAWTLAYVAACAQGRVEAVALGAPTGPFGHIHRRRDAPQPFFDDLGRPAVYPSFHVLAGLTGLADAPILTVEPSRKGKLATLAIRDGERIVLWLANLTEGPLAVELPSGAQRGGRVATLDLDGFEQSATSPDHLDKTARDLATRALTLGPFAVARIAY